jgi:MerR family redox-sensitive transcriptional activator SoxR
MEDSNWTVGRVARRCGVKVSTLHFYEKKGLIRRSWRNAGNQRRYKADVLRRISVIKAAQKMGISLEEIRRALATLPDNRTPTAGDWAALSANWRNDLE